MREGSGARNIPRLGDPGRSWGRLLGLFFLPSGSSQGSQWKQEIFYNCMRFIHIYTEGQPDKAELLLG